MENSGVLVANDTDTIELKLLTESEPLGDCEHLHHCLNAHKLAELYLTLIEFCRSFL